MALRDPLTMFGLHQATFTDRTTKDMFTARVMGDFSNEFNQEQIKLHGGSAAFPWDTAPGNAEASLSLTFKEYSLSLLKYLAGKISTDANVTENASGDALGAMSALVNEVGTTCFSATIGVASVAVKSGEDPIFGNYLVKATGAAAVDVYLDNNLGGITYQDDALKITASPLTVVQSAAVEIPSANIELTGGSGTIGMTTGDICSFTSRPVNTYNFEYKGGYEGASLPEFDLKIITERLSSNKYRMLHFPRVKANGVSFNIPEKDWSTFESELVVMQDSALGYAYRAHIINV